MNRRNFLKKTTGATVLFMISPLERLLASEPSERLWEDICKKYVVENAPRFIRYEQEKFAERVYKQLMEQSLKKSLSSEDLEKKLGKYLPDSLFGTFIGIDGYGISNLETDGFKRLGITPNPNTDLKISEKTEFTVNDGEKGWYMVNNLTYDSDDLNPLGANPGDITYPTIKNPFGEIGIPIEYKHIDKKTGEVIKTTNELTHVANGSRWIDLIFGIKVVPVELSSLVAAVFAKDFDEAENDVNFEWKTSSEKSNYGFDIERSTDKINWEILNEKTIKSQSPTGSSDGELKYNFIDQDLPVGKYFYRLKQVDFDGTFSYSDAIQAIIKAPNNFTLHKNYPNPFNLGTTIGYSLPKNTRVNLTVYNILGQPIKTLINKEQAAGIYSILFNGKDENERDLSSGIYIYRLQTKEFNEAKRMVFLK